jgi:hypothetical protein
MKSINKGISNTLDAMLFGVLAILVSVACQRARIREWLWS